MTGEPGVVTGFPAVLLRSEGGALLALSLFFYPAFGWSWLLYVVLLLAPDVGMLGYLGGTRVGAVAYNAVHTYALPAALGAAGVAMGNGTACAIALIWLGHIGMDRLLGFGLKYPTSFHHTHLGMLGGRARS
ncbi:MAG TPA: DUF4260 domain-containing protein [Candidatus Eisenbacteria bacterium]|nr:DUF4260 domain-containing protein [Candidatus Eisenbacteria bacterium]